MSMLYGPIPQELAQRSSTGPLHRKGTPVPTRRLVRTPADLAVRVRLGAIPASDSVQPAGKSAPHTAARARSESQVVPRGAHANPADSTTSIVRKAAHSDQFAP